MSVTKTPISKRLWRYKDMTSIFSAQQAVRDTYHIREEGGGMFIEADDSLPQLVSPQTIREDPQLPLHLRARIHVGKQLPERQPIKHTEGSYRTCCSEELGRILVSNPLNSHKLWVSAHRCITAWLIGISKIPESPFWQRKEARNFSSPLILI